jgi:hypothetical protein
MGYEAQFNRLAGRVDKLAGNRLPDKCVIQTPSESTNAGGGTSYSYADDNANDPLPCGYLPEKAREMVINGQARSVTPYTLSLPAIHGGAAVEVKPEYRLRVLPRAPLPERIFQVIGDGSLMGVMLEVPALLVEGDN